MGHNPYNHGSAGGGLPNCSVTAKFNFDESSASIVLSSGGKNGNGRSVPFATSLVENGKFGNICINSSNSTNITNKSSSSSSKSAISTICKSAGPNGCIASTLMDAFKKSLTFNETGFPTLDMPKSDNCLSELVLKYEQQNSLKKSSKSSRNAISNSSSSSSSSSSSLHKTFCIACTTREVVPQAKPTNDFFGYLSELLCAPCITKLKKTKEFGSIQAKAKKRAAAAEHKKESASKCEEKLLPELQVLKEKMIMQCLLKNKNCRLLISADEEMNCYWMEVRNAIYQVFLEEGFTLNPVVSKYINPSVCRYCMPPTSMLRTMVKRLYHAHQHKFFLLTVCHVQLFIMEIKLTLLRELVHLENRPYYIFAIFYTLFQRLLRALQRSNLFLDIIETEFLKKNALHWLQIHFLFFQTFVYMNRFIQKSISLLCECSTESGLATEDTEESRLVGKIVYRSYIILEQSMASFSIYTNANSNNFAAFFAKFDDVSGDDTASTSTSLQSKSQIPIPKIKSKSKGQKSSKSRIVRGRSGQLMVEVTEPLQSSAFHLQRLVNIILSHLLFDHTHPDVPPNYSVQFQMLFQFAILLFNCKNYEDNVFARRVYLEGVPGGLAAPIKSLQAMPGLPADLLAVDALNTVAFQLFLVIHHWDSTEVFDNVMRRLPTVECSRSSRSIIKTILTESFIEVGYEERQLLTDFYAFMDVPMPENDQGTFEHLLALEIALSDEEGYEGDEDGGLLEYDDGVGGCLDHHHHHGHHHGSGGHGGPAGHGGFATSSCHNYPHDCDCYDMFCDSHGSSTAGAGGAVHHNHGGMFPPPPPSRRSLEVRERLRQKISTRRQRVGQLVEGCNAAAAALATAYSNNQLVPGDPVSFTAHCETVTDDRKIDDLLSFINGDEGEVGGNTKKRKSKAKKKTKSKKQKNKQEETAASVVVNSNENHSTSNGSSGKKNGPQSEAKKEKSPSPEKLPTSEASKVDDEEEEEEVVELSRVEVIPEKEVKSKHKLKENGHHAKTTEKPPSLSFNSKRPEAKTPTTIAKTPSTKNEITSNGSVQTNGVLHDDEEEDEEDEEEADDDDDLEAEEDNATASVDFSEDEETTNKADDSDDQQRMVELNITNPEEVFMPKDIDLDSEDIDDFEKDLERFKRFCYDTICGYTLDSCKLKLAINVKEIFSRSALTTKQQPSTQPPSHNSTACFASVGGPSSRK